MRIMVKTVDFTKWSRGKPYLILFPPASFPSTGSRVLYHKISIKRRKTL